MVRSPVRISRMLSASTPSPDGAAAHRDTGLAAADGVSQGL
ncbi:hypothetical protein [Alloactinosynnema sp. L-07]|nr:hypothetical protein [Alloactinosynnema sp. L-07]